MELSLLHEKSKLVTQDIYVNSSFRNRSKYPDPNQYTLTLLENFRNVVGADIINPRIPRSEYIVNSKNNRIVFVYTHDEEIEVEVNIPPGDYSVDGFIQTFNGLQVTINQHIIRMSDVPIQSRFVFTANIPFSLNVKQSTISNLIGVDYLSIDTIESQTISDQFEYIYVQTYTDEKEFIVSEPYKIFTHDFHVHVIDSSLQYYLKKIHIPGMKIQISDNLTPIIRFRLDLIHKSTQLVLGVSETERSPLFVFDHDIELNNNDDYQLRLSFTRVEAFDVSKVIIPVQNNPLLPTFVKTDGFNWINTENTHKDIPLYELYGNNVYGIDMDIEIEKRVHSIIPLGKYNLSGTYEIAIRCKELNDLFSNGFVNENHNSHPKSFLFGKMVTLYDTNSFQDYVPLEQPVHFTPVSKLSQLSFSFETIDGDLYDCMGINHSFTMRLYMLHIHTNINIPFKEQTVYPSIEAVNEKDLYFGI